MNPIVIQYQYSEAEHNEQVTASLTFMKAKTSFKFIFCFGIFLLVASIAVIAKGTSILDCWFPLTFGTIFVAMPFWARHTINKAIKKSFVECRFANQLVSWTFSPEKILWSSKDSSSSYEWPALLEVQDCSKAILLFFIPRAPNRVPKAAFSSVVQIDELKSLLQLHKIKLTQGK